jgi:hypothetical protein
MSNIKKLEGLIESEIIKNEHLPIYMFSLDGETKARSPGYYKIQIHFEDSNQPGGVKHITIAEGSELSEELARSLESWVTKLAKKYPGKHPPKILIGISC